MILGAGRGQKTLIESASKLGYETLVVSTTSRNYPGLALADKIIDLDITNSESVLYEAKRHSIDGIATACADTGMETLGIVNEEMKLAGPGSRAGLASKNKEVLKGILTSSGVPTARYKIIHSGSDLVDFSEMVGYPLVVKSSTLQGSQGVTICKNLEEAKAAFNNLSVFPGSQSVLAEEYLDGQEMGAQAFVLNGEVLFSLLHDDEIYSSSIPVPLEHSVPTKINQDLQDKCKKIIRQAIYALHLDNCAVNVDLMIVNQKPYILELTGRVGANGLGEIVSKYFCIDYPSLIAVAAMSDKTERFWNSKHCQHHEVVSRMIPPRIGMLGKLKCDPNIPVLAKNLQVDCFLNKGSSVTPFTSSGDYIGQVVAWAPTTAEARDLAVRQAQLLNESVSRSLL